MINKVIATYYIDNVADEEGAVEEVAYELNDSRAAHAVSILKLDEGVWNICTNKFHGGFDYRVYVQAMGNGLYRLEIAE